MPWNLLHIEVRGTGYQVRTGDYATFYLGFLPRPGDPVIELEPGAYRVVQIYDSNVNLNDTDRLHAAHWQWVADNPPIEGAVDETGWLSPDGQYFSCMLRDKNNLERGLIDYCYTHQQPANLLDEGWLWVGFDKIVGGPPSLAQQNRIRWGLLGVATGVLRRTLKQYLAEIEDATTWGTYGGR